MKIKRIDGYNNYVITNTGRVFNIVSGIELSQHINRKGYAQVWLCEEYDRKGYQVHRLVALAFLLKMEGRNQVNHLDGNKLNNRVENLQWVNNSENMLHAYDNSLITPLKGIEKPNVMFTEKDVHEVCIRLQEGLPVSEIAKELQFPRDRIHRIKDGSNWKHISCMYYIRK